MYKDPRRMTDEELESELQSYAAQIFRSAQQHYLNVTTETRRRMEWRCDELAAERRRRKGGAGRGGG